MSTRHVLLRGRCGRAVRSGRVGGGAWARRRQNMIRDTMSLSREWGCAGSRKARRRGRAVPRTKTAACVVGASGGRFSKGSVRRKPRGRGRRGQSSAGFKRMGAGVTGTAGARARGYKTIWLLNVGFAGAQGSRSLGPRVLQPKQARVHAPESTEQRQARRGRPCARPPIAHDATSQSAGLVAHISVRISTKAHITCSWDCFVLAKPPELVPVRGKPPALDPSPKQPAQTATGPRRDRAVPPLLGPLLRGGAGPALRGLGPPTGRPLTRPAGSR